MGDDAPTDSSTAMNEPDQDVPDAPTSRSPSPPVALTPGRLATQLQEVFNRALAHTTKTCSYNNFAACFPTPAARRPDVLQSVWQQIIGKIEVKARNEFEGIMGERDVVKGLNELELLVQEAKRRKETWEKEGGEKPVPPHTLPPDALFGAHLAPELEPIAKDLRGRIDATSAENEQLADDIGNQRDEVEALLRQLEATVQDLEGANETLGDIVDGQGLRQEVIDMQKDLNDSKL